MSNGHRTLKVGSDNIAAPAITQVRIKRVNNLEQQPEDTALESGGEVSSVEQNTRHLGSNPDLSAFQKKEDLNVEITEGIIKEETLDFKTQKDASNYYEIF